MTVHLTATCGHMLVLILREQAVPVQTADHPLYRTTTASQATQLHLKVAGTLMVHSEMVHEECHTGNTIHTVYTVTLLYKGRRISCGARV